MNIVYTINGEGMGHASRSSVVIDHLLKGGHNVVIFSAANRPLKFLRERFGSCAEVTGLHMVYHENRVKRLHTALRAMGNIHNVGNDLSVIRQSLATFKLDAVITDFDFHGPLIASLYRVPLISIDNVQYITQAKFHVAPEDIINYEISFVVAKMMVPYARYYFITTFDEHVQLRNDSKKSRVFFVPPLLRSKVLQTKPHIGDHILVYQTSDSYSNLMRVLAQSRERYICYNVHRKHRRENIECKDFNEDQFIADLAGAKAVITNGGFTVITESLFLRKPILSVPIKNQYEQKLNGLLLQKFSLGLMMQQISKTSLDEFVGRLDRFREASAHLTFNNTIALNKLDRILSEIERGID